MLPRGFVVGDRILGQAGDSHADWCAAYGSLGTYRFVGASTVGKLHQRHGRPRDDAFSVRTAGPWIAVAVSDGVGSRPLSRYGSAYVVEALCEHLLREAMKLDHGTGDEDKSDLIHADSVSSLVDDVAIVESQAEHPQTPTFDIPDMPFRLEEAPFDCGTLTWYRSVLLASQMDNFDQIDNDMGDLATSFDGDEEQWVREAFQRTRQGLERFARDRGVALDELHCTLMGLLLNIQTGEMAVGQIGDGAVLALHPGVRPVLWVEAPAPEGVGETYVLTQHNWEEYLAVKARSALETIGFDTFYLMTDGVAEDCLYPPPQNITERWARDLDREVRKEIPMPQKAVRLLSWLATYESPSGFDDRTLVIIWR